MRYQPRTEGVFMIAPFREIRETKADFFGQVQSSCRSGGAPQLGVFSERTREGEALMYDFLSVCMEASLQWICEYIASNLDRKIRLETFAEMGRLCVQHQVFLCRPSARATTSGQIASCVGIFTNTASLSFETFDFRSILS